MLLSTLEKFMTRYERNEAKIPKDEKARAAYRKALAEEKLQIKIERLFQKKRMDVLSQRAHTQEQISPANRYASIGDEYRLRQEILLGHRVNIRDGKTGRTVLAEAVGKGHFHIVRMLCYDFDVDVNVPTLLGKTTPLHIAIEKGHRQIASLLLGNGADVNIRDRYGCTPLHRVWSLTCLKLLNKYHADFAVKSNEGLTPLRHYQRYIPQDEHNPEILTILGAKEDKRLFELTRDAMTAEFKIREDALKRFELITEQNNTNGGSSDGKRKTTTAGTMLYNNNYDYRPW